MIKKVLVTGGTGYLGGRIVNELAADNKHYVRATALLVNQKVIVTSPSSEIVHMDLLNDEQIRSACRDVDCIIHLAAVNEIISAREPERALAVNGMGTLKLIRAAEEEGVKRFIYMSTAHIYGAPLAGSITEATLPRPVHPYAITHRVAEDFVLSALSRQALQGVVIRLSNALGSPADPQVDRWSLVANDLCRQVVSNGKMQLRSAGLQMRDFINIADVCGAIKHFMELPESTLDDGLFNLGGENPLSIINLAEIIAQRYQDIFGREPQIIRPPVDSDEAVPAHLFYSIDKLKSTGFKPNGTIEDAIDETLLFCEQHFGH